MRNLSDQGAGNAAVLIAYWAFFSLFPLLLVFVSILGFVLQGDLAAQHTIEHSALSRFPIVGVHPGALRGSGIGLGIGLAGTLLSGLGVTLATENAFQTVYMIPPHAPSRLSLLALARAEAAGRGRPAAGPLDGRGGGRERWLRRAGTRRGRPRGCRCS